jgi:uncharacterized protein YacL
MNKINTDKATILGLWVGVGGFFTGLIGIGLTLYLSYASQPNIFFITLSGWIAALLTLLVSIIIGAKLINLVTKQQDQMLELVREVDQLKNEKQQLISISEFLASKSLKSATPRKVKQEPIPIGIENEN